jgi:hypothetical protein
MVAVDRPGATSEAPRISAGIIIITTTAASYTGRSSRSSWARPSS